MPIYEYQCLHCGHKLEALQKISDAPLVDCPACEQAELKKLVSAASFRLKGGGWYETDFKTGDKKQLAETETAAAPEAKKDAEGKAAEKDSGKGKTESREGSGASDKTADKPQKKADTAAPGKDGGKSAGKAEASV